MVIKSYQTLYVSSLGYGMRKYLLVDQEKALMEEKISELEKDCEEIENRVKKADEENKQLQTQFEMDRQQLDNEHKENIKVEKDKIAEVEKETFNMLLLKTDKAKKEEKQKEKK